MSRLTALCITLILCAGCAGSILNREQKTSTLPPELSKDLQEKFEVREVVATLSTPATPAPSISPQPSLSPAPVVQASEKHRKHAKKKEKKVTGPKIFSYPNRRPPKEPIWIGEKLTYEVTYLGMPAGYFTLEALPFKMVSGRKVYHIEAKAWSSAVFNLIYKVQDWVATYVDYEGFFSHRFELHQDESKQLRDSIELYDSEKGQSYWWNRWDRKEKGKSENKDFYPMDPFPQDSLSSLYYLRSIPLEVGDVVKFPVMSEGKPLDAYVTVVAREQRDIPGGEAPTLKLKPEAATRGVLERKGDSFMWVTDDDRRFLVRIEAKVKIGTVVVNLKKIESGNPPHELEGGGFAGRKSAEK